MLIKWNSIGIHSLWNADLRAQLKEVPKKTSKAGDGGLVRQGRYKKTLGAKRVARGSEKLHLKSVRDAKQSHIEPETN